MNHNMTMTGAAALLLCCLIIKGETLVGAEVTHINQELETQGVGQTFDEIKELVGIQGCSVDAPPRSKYQIGEVDGQDSGVVVDDGKRTIYEVAIRKAKYSQGGTHQVDLRFSYDRVMTSGEGSRTKVPFCGFEFFIKSSKTDQLPTGWALAFDGKVLPEVPTFLANDKVGSSVFASSTDEKSKTVENGHGCFLCHPSVSLSFGIEGAEIFWSRGKFIQSDTKAVIARSVKADSPQSPSAPENEDSVPNSSKPFPFYRIENGEAAKTNSAPQGQFGILDHSLEDEGEGRYTIVILGYFNSSELKLAKNGAARYKPKSTKHFSLKTQYPRSFAYFAVTDVKNAGTANAYVLVDDDKGVPWRVSLLHSRPE